MRNYKNTPQKKDGLPIKPSGCGPNKKWSRIRRLFCALTVGLAMTIPSQVKAQYYVEPSTTRLGAPSATIDTKNLATKGYFTLTMNTYDSHYGEKDEALQVSYVNYITQSDDSYAILEFGSIKSLDDPRQRDDGPWHMTAYATLDGQFIENERNYWEEIVNGVGDRSTATTKRQYYYNGYSYSPTRFGGNENFWSYVSKSHKSLGITSLRIYLPTDLVGKDCKLEIWTKRRFEGTHDYETKEDLDTVELIWPDKFANVELSYKASKIPGKLMVEYRYPSSKNINTGSVIQFETDNGQGPIEEMQHQGSINRTISNVPKKLLWRANLLAGNDANQTVGDPFYQSSHMKDGYTWMDDILPAYVWPVDISTKYDSTGYVDIAFTMPYEENGISENYYIGDRGVADQIEIQRATKPDFSDAKTVTRLDYVWNQGAYKFKDDVRKANIEKKLYYRFRRTASKDLWGWDYCMKDSTEAISELSRPVDVTARLDMDSLDFHTARIEWKLVERIWPEGSKLRIIKRNQTTGETSTLVDLNQKEAQKGVYLDENLITCNKMSYSLQLILPSGTEFEQPKAVPAVGDVITSKVGRVSDLEVSKGYFDNRVDLKWKVSGGFDAFRIRRVEYGTNDTITIENINSTASEVMLTSDEKGAPGVYYTYLVDGMVVCDKQPLYCNAISSIGFRSPTGNIYGRLTFENGQPVPNADVLVESDKPLGGNSILFDGKDDYLIAKEEIELGDNFTLQAYVGPENTNSGTVLYQKGVYELKLNNGNWEFTSGNKTVSTPYVEKTGMTFTHVSAVKAGKKLLLYIDGEKIDSITDAATASTDSAATFIGCKDSVNFFQGRIDEVRLWNEALDKDIIKRDFTRQLYGGENGLQAYWRFNDGIADEFYDLSCTGNEYHQNHGKIHGAVYDKLIPAQSQLALKGVTDDRGNYNVSGIPYTGQGTMYRIIPSKGTHQFDPAHHQRMVANGALSHTCDFTDNSSFSVQGHVFYENSTVPVEGASFTVDGKAIFSDKGQLSTTNSEGFFNINVPVGYHDVRVTKPNHHFVLDGRIVDHKGQDLNYQRNEQSIVLYDSTRVKLIGRIGGGAIQDSLKLGHALSTNNMGDNLKITMRLVSGDKYMLCKSKKDSLLTGQAFRPSNVEDSASWHKKYDNQVTYNVDLNQIEIYPNKLTGEFVAYVIPDNFIVPSVEVKGYGNLLTKADNIDLSLAFVDEVSENVYKDSVKVGDHYVYTEYCDSVTYNYAYKKVKRFSPSLEVKQCVPNRMTVQDFFGDQVITTNTVVEDPVAKTTVTKLVNIPIWTETNGYLFELPVFNTDEKYRFKISAFEEIRYNNSTEKIDRVAVTDGVVTINNEMTEFKSMDKVNIGENGEAYYSFKVGTPNISSPDATKQLSIDLDVKGNVTSWNNGTPLKGIVVGRKPEGKRFVTQGPDEVKIVLRDPPGSHSYTYIEEGSVIETTRSKNNAQVHEGTTDWVNNLGLHVVTMSGAIATYLQAKVEISQDIGGGFVHNDSHEGSKGETETMMLNSIFQTSDDPMYVGADGDLFIGNSYNIGYGMANNICIILKSDFNETTDELLDTRGDYVLIKCKGMDFDQQYATTFAYPQAFIENTMIPDLTNVRNQFFLSNTLSEAAAQAKANADKKQYYLSKLPMSDPNFGKNNDSESFTKEQRKNATRSNGPSYKIITPEGELADVDTIRAFNQRIQNWIHLLSENERTKVEARDLLKNYSFQAGSFVEFSQEQTHAHFDNNTYSIGVGPKFFKHHTSNINDNGIEFRFEHQAIISNGETFENSQSKSSKLGFVLADEGSTDYHSVDVFREPVSKEVADKLGKDVKLNNYIFKLKGGATSCPYEQEYRTKYFEPGSYIIDQGTAQVEKPKIVVDQPTVTNVPSARHAVYTLRMRNESEIETDCTYDLHVVEGSNPNGVKFFIDGTPLGNGRTFVIPKGEEIVKTLEVGIGTQLNNEGLQLVLHSQCQYTNLDFKENICDIATINAHFLQSCSDVHIAMPNDKWTLNSKTEKLEDNVKHNRMHIKVDGYDPNYKNFKAIKIQYKPSAAADNEWITKKTFYVLPEDYEKANSGEKGMLPVEGYLEYDFDMAKLNDQKYDICAVTVCWGPEGDIETVSNIVSGIKDTTRPSLFGAAQPADGVLHFEDDIRLNFNETIAEGLLTSSNFEVYGTRNGAVLTHDASLRFDGQNDYLATEAGRNFNGKSFTVDMALYLDKLDHESTIFSHGNVNNSFEISLIPDTLLKVKLGNQIITTDKPIGLRNGEWNHIAVVYDNDLQQLTAYSNKKAVISRKVMPYSGEGNYEIGRSISAAGNYFCGKLSELRVWDRALNNGLLTRYKDISLKGSEIGLWAYYPMNECRGNIAIDKARGANAIIKDAQWFIGRRGLAVQLDGNAYLQLSTGAIPVSKDYDYTLEFWFKGAQGQKNVALVSNGRGDNEEEGGSADKLYIGFNEFGKLILKSNGHTQYTNEKDYLDNAWHHYALCVNRNGRNANIYVDSEWVAHFDADLLENLSADFMLLGARGYFAKGDAMNKIIDQYFKGGIDEFRLWNLCKNQTMVKEESNITLKGSEMGLLTYYPFETYVTSPSNRVEMEYSLADAAKQGPNAPVIPDAVSNNVKQTADSAPIKERGALEPLSVNFVVNNDALILSPTSSNGWNDYEQSIVTFKVKNVQDVNGNKVKSPIAWTAYIDRNQLLWSEDELNLDKKIDEAMTFEVDLVNKSGTVQQYSIENQPAWLEVSQENGSIDPQKNKHIRFTVNEGLNIGTYNEVLYLVNENGVARALELNLKVKGEQPDWKVDEKAYNFNMSIFAEMFFDGVPSNDADDMVGIFKNGKCVGKSNSTYDKKRDMWYTYLMIYSDEMAADNKDMKDSYEFRLWDASNGMLYLGEVNQLVFDHGNCGSIKNLLQINGKEMKFRNLALEKGWNWVSFATLPSSSCNSDQVLKNGNWMNNDVIKNNNVFDTYSELQQQWVGTIGNTYDRTRMYMIHAGIPQNLYVSGTENASLPVNVEGGKWNYIGYTPAFNLSVNEALADYHASEGDLIKSQSQFAMYTDGDWVGNMKHMEINKGYLLYRKAADSNSFSYPSVRGAFSQKMRSPYALTATDECHNKYALNMTLIATPIFKDLQEGDLIIARINGESRGRSQKVTFGEQDLHFLTISGNADDNQVVFTLERDGEQIAQASQTIPFVANAHIGAVNQSTAISFDNAEDNVSVYPNPFVSQLNIRFFAEQDGKAEISVYDLAGRRVMHKDIQAHAGINLYTWNGTTDQTIQCAGGVHVVRVTVNGKTSVHEVIKK